MKKYVLHALVAIILINSGAIFGLFRHENNDTVRICTYNIRRMGSEKEIKNLWKNRKGLVFDTIQSIHPDIIGFQEVTKDQFDDLRSVLADYKSFGEPRSAKMTSWWQRLVMKHPNAKDEHNPLFYNIKRVNLLKKGNFGINPRGIIMTAHLPRICTWGIFQDIKTGTNFYVFNTHLDNASSLIRTKQIDIILGQIKKVADKGTVVFMGDLNMTFDGKTPETNIIKAKKNLEAVGVVNAKSIAQHVAGPAETRTGWNNSELKMIDHIFVKPHTAVVKEHVVVASPVGIFPSDHRPVFIDIVE